MKNNMLFVSACALAAFAIPAAAQTGPGMMTPDQVGAQPMMGTSPTDFVAKAADSDAYEIGSSKVALMKAKDPKVKAFAREMIKDHAKTTAGLKSALASEGNKIAVPNPPLMADSQSKIDTLKSTPADQFDQVYIQQQLAGHQQAWALTSGYANDGTDPALKAAAAKTVPVVEHHLGELKAMPGAGGAM